MFSITEDPAQWTPKSVGQKPVVPVNAITLPAYLGMQLVSNECNQKWLLSDIVSQQQIRLPFVLG
jgi:hypothetical protein